MSTKRLDFLGYGLVIAIIVIIAMWGAIARGFGPQRPFVEEGEPRLMDSNGCLIFVSRTPPNNVECPSP